MYKFIEDFVNSSEQCQINHDMLPCTPAHPWGNTKIPWVRIHIDYVGQFVGKMFVLIANSFSKCIEVFPVETSSSKLTIRYLKKCFATHGLPQVCVTDNASCFTSEEFAVFPRCSNIRHITSAP